ncbi:hypothetical protein FEA48_11030 [Pseudomonas nitroreducens]|uniref:Uncharacterized protein n=1 Tax=Pseudomonas nitroreducens TaxID=46680 RepID=A0A5R9A866_PSENT|nr:hypothetical protein [Pseudomonas nitroreducens]TLP74740.1 hypothetical protein FEA48_11030 [Pseudomonas nitroreducens]
MSNPKFSVGEVVIFYCPDWPEHYRQEYTVLAVLRGGDTYAGYLNEWPSDEFAYDLGFTVPESNLRGCTFWDERVLRKRHVPGGMTFFDLVASLRTANKRAGVSHA